MQTDTTVVWNLFLVSMVVYVFLSSRDMLWNDSAEIVVAARTFSVLHPSGYPWYSLLTSGMWFLLGSWGVFGVNAFSGIGAAVCVFPLYATARRWDELPFA